MAAVADLERLLERLFERTFARLFRSRVQAEQVERLVERAMEEARTGRGGTTLVPSRYRVRLGPADLDDLAVRNGGPQALALRLADGALAFARRHGYHLADRPIVSLVADPSVEQGRVAVDAVAGAGHLRAGDPSPVGAPPARSAGAPVPSAVDEPAGNGRDASSAIRGAGVRPYAVRPAPGRPARALLRVSQVGASEREVLVEGQGLTLGRAPDNGLVIEDARVSRHHGRFQARNGILVYTDLGSTNGSRVNGIRVDEIVLGAGDHLQVGDAVVVVEQVPG